MRNNDLLYSTGNSTQYSVMTYMEKESRRVDRDGCGWEVQEGGDIYIYLMLIHVEV